MFSFFFSFFFFFFFQYEWKIFSKTGPEYKNSKLNNYNGQNVNTQVLKQKKQAHQY